MVYLYIDLCIDRPPRRGNIDMKWAGSSPLVRIESVHVNELIVHGKKASRLASPILGILLDDSL